VGHWGPATRLRTIRSIGATARQGGANEDASERSEASHARAFAPTALRRVHRSFRGGGNGASRRSGSRESVSGGPRGRSPPDL